MAEAVAVLGALSSAVQLVDCISNIVSYTHALVSSDGQLERERLKRIAEQYGSLGRTSEALGQEYDNSAESDPPSSTLPAGDSSQAVEEIAYSYEHLPAIQNRLKAAKADSKEDENVIALGVQCDQESRRLIQMLTARDIDPGMKGVKKSMKAVKTAIKTARSRKDVDMCRANLQDLNAQLSTAIIQALYKQQQRRKSQVKHELQFREVNDMLYKPGDDAVKLASLIQWQRRALRMKKIKNIIASLKFTTIEDRLSAVERAYPSTYEWTLSHDSSRLYQWLQDEVGIYWVTGKAGSGKSTLMKFLCKHKQTERLLEKWGGDTGVLIASFFFWYAGTTLQKSITGLLRTICKQILAHEPGLAEVAFPNLFEGHEYDDATDTEFDWDDETLVQGLMNMTSSQAATKSNKKYCFFIDGLDEYKGNHLKLIALLRDLAATETIKLCVSSRPWNVFRSAFGSEIPQLRLEDLSRPDIDQYTRGEIHSALRYSSSMSSSEEGEVFALVEEIVRKAEGVFLWVVLVVKSVISGLAEGDPIFMLRHRVQHFPADLDLFFKCMLGRVELVYKPQTHQALKLAFLFAQDSGEMQELSTFIDFWLIGRSPKGIDKPAFVHELAVQTVTLSEISDMIQRTQTMLCSACKDLLSITHTEKASIFAKVDFLHRTVYDFLQSDEMQHLLDDGLPDHFKSQRIFHLLNLARLKFVPSEGVLPHRLPRRLPRRLSEEVDLSEPIEANLPRRRARGVPPTSDEGGLASPPREGSFVFTSRARGVPFTSNGGSLKSMPSEGSLVSGPCEISSSEGPQQPKAVGKSGKLSIAILHQDLDIRYLEGFAAVIVQYEGESGLDRYLQGRIDQLHRFLAFPTFNIKFPHLYPPQADRYESTVGHRQRIDFFEAALGEHELNQFDIDQANISVIEQLCELVHVDGTTSRGEYCSSNGWEVFIRKWAIWMNSSTYLQKSTSEREESLRHAWKVSQVFIRATHFRARFHRSGSFCGNPLPERDRAHRHERHSICEFLAKTVPEDWLRDVPGIDRFILQGLRRRRQCGHHNHSRWNSALS